MKRRALTRIGYRASCLSVSFSFLLFFLCPPAAGSHAKRRLASCISSYFCEKIPPPGGNRIFGRVELEDRRRAARFRRFGARRMAASSSRAMLPEKNQPLRSALLSRLKMERQGLSRQR